MSEGHALIFNHEKFSGAVRTRKGTEQDVIALEKTFKELNITTKIYDDYTVAKIKQKIHAISIRDFTKERYLIVTILSHGYKDNVISAKDATYNMEDVIVSPICTNPTLAGKPKIFLIEACKGNKIIQRYGGEIPDDVFLFYATTEDYLSYRNAGGTFFIQTLCNVLNKFGRSKPFTEIVDIVSDEVKEWSRAVYHYQIPDYEGTLSEDFYL